MGTVVCLCLLTVLSYCGTQGQVISQPDDLTVCEDKGEGAVFTCVLNSNIRSDDVQWYRFIKDTSTTEMVDPNGENINFLTRTIRDTMNNGSTSNNESTVPINNGNTSSSLTITNAIKSYTGYFWVGTPSLNVCNVSLTVTTSPSALTVNIVKNIESSSIVVQWDAVDDFLHTTYTVTWGDHNDQFDIVDEQTSYTITGLTLNTVYTITVTAGNTCGGGPEFRTSVSFSTDTTSTISTISSTVTASTNPMTIISTVNPSSTSNPSTTPMTTNSITTTVNGNADISASRNPDTTITTTTITNSSITIATNIVVSSTNIANTPTTDETSDSNVGVIAGAAIGGIIVVIIIVLIVFILICCFWRKKNTEKNNYNDLSGDGTLNKTIPLAPNPLDANHDHGKPETESSHQPSSTVEVLYMTSDIGNKKPSHLYSPLESAPQKGKTDNQIMEYAVIDDSKKKEQNQQNGETDIQLQQPMEYAVTVVDTSKKKNKKGDKQQSGKTDTQQQPMEYAVVDKSKKKNQNKDKQQNLHYAELQTLPAPTDTYIGEDNSQAPYALVF